MALLPDIPIIPPAYAELFPPFDIALTAISVQQFKIAVEILPLPAIPPPNINFASFVSAVIKPCTEQESITVPTVPSEFCPLTVSPVIPPARITLFPLTSIFTSVKLIFFTAAEALRVENKPILTSDVYVSETVSPLIVCPCPSNLPLNIYS